jgi:hypothetical protein
VRDSLFIFHRAELAGDADEFRIFSQTTIMEQNSRFRPINILSKKMQTKNTFPKGDSKMKYRILLFVCLAVFVFPTLWKTKAVQAASISFPATTSVPLTETDWSDQPISFPKFDPSLGTLTNVQLDFGGITSWTVQVQATNPSEGGSVGFNGHIHTSFTINNLENTVTISSLDFDAGYIQGSAGALQTVIYLNGTFDPESWAGPSGGIQYSDPSILIEFSGSGDLLMLASTFSHFDLSSSNPDWVQGYFDSKVSLTGTITYNYNAVPEPSVIILLLSSMISLFIIWKK